MMTMQRASFMTTDEMTIAYYTWTPASTAKAVLMIAHGIGEHAQRYAHVAQALSAQGFVVVAPDHRGHGNSSGERAYFDNFDQPVADLHQLFNLIHSTYAHLPVFLYGHSMGSGIALLYALRYQQALRGLIVSGTVTNVEDGQNALVIRIASLLAAIFPKARLVPAIPTHELSTDGAEVRIYEQDALNDHGKTRLGMGAGIIAMGRDIRQRAHTLTLPILLLHGADDIITPVSGTHTIYDLVVSADKTKHIFPGMRHEVVNEVGREQVITMLITWLNQHS